jgi:solute carrier family 25 phosphate transporter 23/24/25/41
MYFIPRSPAVLTRQVGLNFMIYEGLRHYFTPEGQKDPGSIAKLVSGALSGALAQTCTYPL